MRFNFTRLSLLKFFILNKKFKIRALNIINLAIFLTLFALTSALISLFIENKINIREFELFEIQRKQNSFHKARTTFPILHKTIDTAIEFDRLINRFNLFLLNTKFGDKIISHREFYFYRFHALFAPTHDVFTEYIGPGKVISKLKNSKPDIDYIEDLKALEIKSLYDLKEITYLDEIILVLDYYFAFLEPSVREEMMVPLIDKQKKLIEKFDYLNKKYKEIKKDITDFEQYKAITKKNLLKENRLNTSSYEKYEDYYEIAWETNLWVVDGLEFIERIYLHIMTIQKFQMENLNKEIIDLSKKESELIYTAFFLQLIIFLIIQFFEISSVTSEINNKKKKI